jgi:tryptophanyl-tRNA synthetase
VPRILSGIQPTGDMHLGNYVGAVRQWVSFQHEFDAFYPVVDLHAITLPYDPSTLRAKTREVATMLLAAGLDPDVCTVFVQSHVPEHTELNWLLNHLATVGELRRMTQYKVRAERGEEGGLPAGYFNYPVLQAADILIYQADLVPVGEDQRQHLELTRDLAGRFNHRFGQTFVLPEAYIPKVGGRVMDLQRPGEKMSKSADSPNGTVLVLDPPDRIRKKIRSAVTDTGREIVARPDKLAITNLLELFSIATGKAVPELEAAYAGRGYGEFKADLAEALIAMLAPVRERYEEYSADPRKVDDALEAGAAKAQAIARANLALAKERMGFLPRADEPR